MAERGQMDRLFLFSSAARREPAVEAWLADRPDELGVIARHWFEVLRRCGRDVREVLHDGHPTACVGCAAFAYVNAFKSHVNVGFFHGSELPDPKGLLQGAGKWMRHVKLRPEAEIDHDALMELIVAAYADIKRRLDARELTA